MTYLLDTNVISEFGRERPHQSVINWLEAHQSDLLFLSVITIGEIQQGITRLPPSPRREQLAAWLVETLLPAYADRILPVNAETMLQWGALMGRLISEGRKMPAMDALIAATALQHSLPLVTRNVQDFGDAGIELVNPWDESV